MKRTRQFLALAMIVSAGFACGDDEGDENEGEPTDQTPDAGDDTPSVAQQLCSSLEAAARQRAEAAPPSAQFDRAGPLPSLEVDGTAYTLVLPADEMGGSDFEGFAEVVVESDATYAVALGSSATLTIIPRPMGPPTPSVPTETASGADTGCPDAVTERSLFDLSASASQGVHYFQLSSTEAEVDISVIRVEP
ncbi:MAG: hypothetical protein AAFQ65_10440 [Myxococcota bacterium]